MIRNKFSEINKMRRLMDLPLLVEQEAKDITGDEKIQVKIKEFCDGPANLNCDYWNAVRVANMIDVFWKGGPDHESMFDDFQEFWDDDDTGAAARYRDEADSILARLSDKITDGVNNQFYIDISDWLDRIILEIDAYAQDPQKLTLKSPDGFHNEYFSADPEIDAWW